MKKRICPDCKTRELDHRQIICSECRVINKYLSDAKTESRPERASYKKNYYKKERVKADPLDAWKPKTTDEQKKMVLGVE